MKGGIPAKGGAATGGRSKEQRKTSLISGRGPESAAGSQGGAPDRQPSPSRFIEPSEWRSGKSLLRRIMARIAACWGS